MYWLLVFSIFWSMNYGSYDGYANCMDAGKQATEDSWALMYTCVPRPAEPAHTH